MKTYKVIISFLILAFISINLQAQGCSDAGFCTLPGFKPGIKQRITYNNQLRTGISYGQADYGITILAGYLEYSRRLSEKLILSSKLTGISQSGNDSSVRGVSDVFFKLDFSAKPNLKLSFGTKIPLEDGNRIKNGLPLPMDYQSSLGTFDLILGVGYDLNKLGIILAIQQPVTQNDNTFLAGQYPESSKLNNIQSTNEFKRMGDLMLRISYPFNIRQDIQLTLGLLPIYHLANDRYVNAEGVEVEISGSRGLTLNSNLFLDYQINERNLLQLNLGMPFITRDSRPDGLTRHYLVSLEYGFRF